MFQVGSWHYDKGGTDLFVKTIAHWLARQGHKVVVLVHRLEEEDCDDEDIKIGKGLIKVRYTPKQRKGVRFNPFVYGWRLMVTSKHLYKLANAEKIDAIVVGEAELLATLSLKLFTNVKVVCRGGALMYETMSKEVLKERGGGLYSKLFTLLLKLYNNFSLKLPDAMVPVNEAEYEFMNKKKRKNARIITIPHGIPLNLFKFVKRTGRKKVVVGYVGRLAPIKYPEIALEIFKRALQDNSKLSKRSLKESNNQTSLKKASVGVKNSEFVWIGPLDPSFKEDYFDNLKKKIGVSNARWLGRIDNNKLPLSLGKMDVFLQVEQQKNVSRSTPEAAATGLPVVALNKGKEDYGFFTMDKSKAIDELSKLIKDSEYRLNEGKRVRDVIEKGFSEDATYGAYVELFKGLVRK